MPVEVMWDDDAKTIIRQKFEGIISLDDYYKATDDFVTLASSVDYTVHSIFDRREIEKSEGSFIKAMQYANKQKINNLGIRVVLQASSMTKTIVNMGRYLAPDLIKNIIFAETIEEAHQHIAEFETNNSRSY
ncbi:MAG: hypothetical protein Phog2KO_39110 [Phototrophicaceae bacterium]